MSQTILTKENFKKELDNFNLSTPLLFVIEIEGVQDVSTVFIPKNDEVVNTLTFTDEGLDVVPIPSESVLTCITKMVEIAHTTKGCSARLAEVNDL